MDWRHYSRRMGFSAAKRIQRCWRRSRIQRAARVESDRRTAASSRQEQMPCEDEASRRKTPMDAERRLINFLEEQRRGKDPETVTKFRRAMEEARKSKQQGEDLLTSRSSLDSTLHSARGMPSSARLFASFMNPQQKRKESPLGRVDCG